MPVLDGKVPVFIDAEDVQQIQSAVAFAEQEKLRLVIVGGYDAPGCGAAQKARCTGDRRRRAPSAAAAGRPLRCAVYRAGPVASSRHPVLHCRRDRRGLGIAAVEHSESPLSCRDRGCLRAGGRGRRSRP